MSKEVEFSQYLHINQMSNHILAAIFAIPFPVLEGQIGDFAKQSLHSQQKPVSAIALAFIFTLMQSS